MIKKRLISLLCILALLLQLGVPMFADTPEVDLSGVAKAGYASVKVSWEPFDGAVSYTLLRGSDETSMAEIATDLTGTSYTDTDVVKGNHYWYCVNVQTDTETLSGVPFRTDYTVGIEGLQKNAAVHYEFSGEDAVFDGTRTIDKTEDLDKIKNLSQGTIIVRARYTGSPDTRPHKTYRSMFGIGNSTNDSTKQIVMGACDGGTYGFIGRYEMGGGLYNTAMTSVPYSDGKWHTIAFTNGNAYVRTAADGINGSGPADGCYSDSKWNGFITRGGSNLSYFTIGGFSSPNNRSYPYSNWIGEIAFITITDEVLTEQQLKEVTGYFNFDVNLDLDDNNVENPADVGAIVGNFTLSGADSEGATYSLSEGAGHNDKFLIEDGALKIAEALDEFASYTIIVKVEKPGKEATEFSFKIYTEGDYSTPILIRNDTTSLPPFVSYPELVTKAGKVNDLTIKVKFVQTSPGIGSLIGFSNSSANSNHFHVYVNGSTIGYELRGISGSSDISAAASGLRSLGLNTIAFKADSSDYTFKLFANGKLVDTKQLDASTYRMVKDIIGGINSLDLGRTHRPAGQNSYYFSGYILGIEVYGSTLSDEELIDYTAATQHDGEALTNIFEATGSRFYRIPALYTLEDNTVMAAIDARFGSAADSPNNLDTAISFLAPGSETWSPATMPFHFADYSDQPGYAYYSASFIDPTIVQANDGTIFMIVDAFPSGYGYPNAKYGTGMKTVDGEKYLALTQKGKSTDDWANFDHYIKNGIVYKDGGIPTDYTVDENFYLYKNGELLYVDQKNPDGTLTGKKVPMSIFYADADYKLYGTSYLWIASSTDNGQTWSAPRILNYLKRDEDRFYGTGPGRGLVIKNGEYSGRILLPTYDSENGERSSMIYSDDNGATWKRGNRVTMANENSPGKASESQLVELPDGTIRIYARGNTRYIGYADSYDGGVTFEPMRQDPALLYCGNCMISVINYSKPIDGKPAIILSSPEGPNRNNGIVRIGLINENPAGSAEKYSIEWKYKFSVNKGPFVYSCLTEMPNGDIGLLYETDPNTTPCTFAVYTMDELKAGKQKNYESFEIAEPDVPVSGESFTVCLKLKDKIVPELSNIDEAYLTISYPGTDWESEQLSFSYLGEDNKSLYFTGTMPESYVGFSYVITIPEDIQLFTMLGEFLPDTSAVLQGEVGVTEPRVTATLTCSDMAELDEEYIAIFGVESDVLLTAIYATITYDAENFEFVKVESILDGTSILAYDANVPGKVRVVIGTEGEGKEISGDKDVFSVTLKAIKSFDLSEISAANISVSDGDGFVISAESVSKVVAMEVSVPGDLNGDGEINIGDLGIAAGFYGYDSSDEDWFNARRADIDNNGKVDIEDLIFIARKIIGI